MTLDKDTLKGAMVDRLIDFDILCEDQTLLDAVQDWGGIPVREAACVEMHDDYDPTAAEPLAVEWVTPLTTYNRHEGPFASRGNERSVSWAYGPHYGDVCMIVRIGKAGDRLAYPTGAQVERAYRQSRY
jgi:hypothetical protein